MNIILENFKGIRLLKSIMVICFLLILGRLVNLQIINHSKYVKLARQEQVKRLIIPAKRGRIYAMSGSEPSLLVLNETVYNVFADPEVVKSKSKVVAALKEIAPKNILGDLEEKLSKDGSRYQVVALGLSREQAEKLKAKKLAGVGFHAISQRVYPEGKLAAQVLGFVNSEGGQYGIEGSMNNQLAGKDGVLEAVTDVAEVPLTIGEQYVNEPAVDGKNIVLSIDKNIQAQAEKILSERLAEAGADKGSLLVIDPQTGKVMAMANNPTYNPKEFSRVEEAELFNNDIVTSPYEPGSVMKVFTLATGLDMGLISPSTTYNNLDYVTVGDRTIRNAYRGFTGTITMQTALNYSLNTGMVNVLSRLGGGSINNQAKNNLYDYFYNRFNFGKLTDIELIESPGTVVSPDKVEGNAVRYANMAFGQGLDLTMIQVASAMSAVANGGFYYQPSVVAGYMDDEDRFIREEPKLARQNVVSDQTSTTIRKMMVEGRSTLANQTKREGFEIGGKTGTSETIRDGKYVMNVTIASYLGFGGGNRPEYVIMVRVSGSGKQLEGDIHAAPIFNDMSNWLINYLKIQPKG